MLIETEERLLKSLIPTGGFQGLLKEIISQVGTA